MNTSVCYPDYELAELTSIPLYPSLYGGALYLIIVEKIFRLFYAHL
jgi:hypothetical protein